MKKSCCYLCITCPHSDPPGVMTLWRRWVHWWHDNGYGHDCRHLRIETAWDSEECLDCGRRWAWHTYVEWR